MRFRLALVIYRLLLPLLFLAAFPGWLRRMLQRGGLGSGLHERVGRYSEPPEFEPCATVHLHAISVGEAMLAVKLARAWHAVDPERRFVVATGTATGHAVATHAGLGFLRVTYAPLDFPGMVRRYLDRFEPAQIVLVEGEAWPHLLLECRRRGIPVSLVNARLSPRSAARFARLAAWVRPLFGMLDALAVQDPADAAVWQNLGVEPGRIHATGSLKIDPGSGPPPARRPEFAAMLEPFGAERPVILAASTHAGEEPWIADAIRAAVPAALPVIVPRHAERRGPLADDLKRAGFEVVLRSAFRPPTDAARACLVVDSTGELRDWTAHAAVVIIGKSFHAVGGQNPCEAIIAGKPVICGPHMENFEPLATQLTGGGAIQRPTSREELVTAIRHALDPAQAAEQTTRAAAVLHQHHGATNRLVALLARPRPKTTGRKTQE